MRRSLMIATALLSAAACSRSSGPAAPAPAPGGAAPARPAAASTDPASVWYQPGTSRYRIETEQHTTQEMMGNTQTIDATTTQVMSVTLTAQGDSLAMRATLDSMNVNLSTPTGGSPEAADMARRLVGQSVSGYITRSGRLGTLTPSDTAAAMQQIVNGMRDFFMVVPAPPLTAGREWTDTITNTQAMGPLSMQTRAVRTHRIAGWETRDGVRALRVNTSSNYTVTGSGEAQGQPLEIAGSGRALVDRFISATGMYLGATESDSADMNVNVVSVGMQIPVRRTQRATVTRLP